MNDYDDASAMALTWNLKGGLYEALLKAHIEYLERLPDEDYVEAGVWFGTIEYLAESLAILFRDRIKEPDIDDELNRFRDILAMYVKNKMNPQPDSEAL